MYKIMIIEDDADIRDELTIMLENALYQVVAAENFENLSAQVAEAAPDLLLLDVQLPGTDGFALCRQIRRESDLPVIFVTSRSSSMDELNGMMLGGDDYINKPYCAPVLLARIAAVLKRLGKRRDDNRDPYEFQWEGCCLNLLEGTVSKGEHRAELTKNELRICYNLFSKAGQIISREDIIDDLWDNQIFIDDNTLSVNITRIRGKLKEIGAGDLIKTRRGQGYSI